MPTILTKPSPKEPFKYLKSWPVLAGLICAALVVSGGLWVVQSKNREAYQVAVSPTPTPSPPCSVSDQTFCPIQAKFTGYVQSGDFSDVLEQEISNKITCGDATTAQVAACDDIQSGLAIQIYPVNDHGSIKYLSRNDYIAYFNHETTTTGSFHLSSVTAVGGGFSMVFAGSKSGQIVLPFLKQKSVWQLQAPVVE